MAFAVNEFLLAFVLHNKKSETIHGMAKINRKSELFTSF
jgi:hypothetical protein